MVVLSSVTLPRHAIEPTDNRPADGAGERVTRLAYLLAFLRLGEAEMIDPAVAVADNVVAALHKFRCHRWVALKGKRTREDCRPDLVLIGEIDAVVDPDAAAILGDGLLCKFPFAFA